MLSALGAVELATHKRSYFVGEAPTYAIRGATPGAAIAWTSFKDGISTGEYQAYYGHTVGADGTVILPTTGPWREEDVGLWQKQAIILKPDNTQEVAQVFFSVSSPSQEPATPIEPDPAPDDPSFFDQTINLFGTSVPTWMLLAGGGALLFMFTRR